MERLKQRIASLDGQSYKAYKTIAGRYHFHGFDLQIDHVQGDPFANPSRCRVFISAQVCQMKSDFYSSHCRKVALEDFLGRSFTQAIAECVQGHRGSGMSGEMLISDYGQQVLERNAVVVDSGAIELRLQIGLPADKRTINAGQAMVMLFDELPKVVEFGLKPIKEDSDRVKQHVDTVDNQRHLRSQLQAHQLVAFVADGSRLPRKSGIDEHPLADPVPCYAPDSLAVELTLIDGTPVRGLGIAEGLCLIVGGGFHGKSTLLHALERGVYDHIPGDGRERIVTVDDAVKIRSEDRRAISEVDISLFINNLPQGKPTQCFSTQDASGSTSQAANIMEALATGSKLLLIDEDTSANNFMIRDQRMQQLVTKDKEPITPLIQRLDDLKRANQVSLILVMGGSGDFFASADTVIMLDNYQLKDVTEQAKQLAEPLVKGEQQLRQIKQSFKRVAARDSFSPLNRLDKEKIQALETRILRYGMAEIDVSQIEQLVNGGQLNAIGYILRYLYLNDEQLGLANSDITEVLKTLLLQVQDHGLDIVCPYVIGTMAMPRHYELVATVNRMRNLTIDPSQKTKL